MKYFLSSLLAILILSACNFDGRVLKGNVLNAENLNISFEQYDALTNAANVLAKGETNSSGDFKIPIPKDLTTGVYRVRIGAKSAYLLLDGETANIELYSDLSVFDRFDYQVNGSKLTQEFQEKMLEFARKTITQNQFIGFARVEGSPLVSYLISIISMNSPNFAEVFKEISSRLQNEYGDLEFVRNYELYATQLENQLVQARNNNTSSRRTGGLQIGSEAPDISLPDPSGNQMKLSDLKGNIVLLDFWASWCGPCRRANPHVVETYKKYKDQGFTVFSVSLDGLDERTLRRYQKDQVEYQMQRQKERWVNAIKQDKLEWDYHVSDLKKWDSQAAALYGVRSIPRTYLIDRNGKIASINPRYDLEDQLKKLL